MPLPLFLPSSDTPPPSLSSRYPGFWHRLVSLEARASIRQTVFSIIYLPITYFIFGIILGKLQCWLVYRARARGGSSSIDYSGCMCYHSELERLCVYSKWHIQYSGTRLLWTPFGPGEASCLERCPYFRLLRFGVCKVSLIQRCPYFRGILQERFHCIKVLL